MQETIKAASLTEASPLVTNRSKNFVPIILLQFFIFSAVGKAGKGETKTLRDRVTDFAANRETKKLRRTITEQKSAVPLVADEFIKTVRNLRNL